MADLPSIPDRLITAKPPESRVSPAAAASPYLELADTLGYAAKEVGAYANREAEKEGLKAVTRDADGNVKVERPFIVGDAALHYEQGVKVAAVADGENVIKTDMLAMRHEFQNDPEGFRKAAETYGKTKALQYEKAAGPAVGVALGKIANDTAREFHEGLLNKKEHQDLSAAKMSIEAQIETTKNEIFAIAAGGDTSSPEYVQRLQKIGALQGQLVSNPKFGVPKEVAEYNMSRLTSELSMATFGYKLGEVQKRDGTEAALRMADQIRTDPSLNLTPTERFGLHTRLVGGIMQAQRAEEAINKKVSADIDQVGDIAAQGLVPPPAQIAALRQKVEATGNPALFGKLRDVEQVAPIVAEWRKSSPQQLELTLAGLDSMMRKDGATPTLLKLRETGQALLKNMREENKTNPLGWSNTTGSLPVQPIDWASPDVPGQLRNRASTAESIAAKNGAPVQYMTPDERSQISQVAAIGGQPMLDLARTMVAGFGDKAGTVMREISKEAPVFAHIGGLMQSGGSPALIRDAADAVRLEANPDYKHPRWLEKESDTIQAEQHKRVVDVYGGAFLMEGDTGRASEMTAQKAFFTRSARTGYDPKLEESASRKTFDRTLQEAAGATFDPRGVQYGGTTDYKTGSVYGFRTNSKVFIPGNIRADYFSTVLGSITDDDIKGAVAPNGKPYTARDLQGAIPVATRGGYRFAVGDPASDDPKWIRGADGKPFVFDIVGMEPILRKRVPAAYSGGP